MSNGSVKFGGSTGGQGAGTVAMCLNLPQNIIRLAPENCQSSVHPVRQGAPGQTVYAALANNLRSSCNTQKFRLKYACPQTGLNDGERKFTAGTNKNECQLKGVSTPTHTHTAGTHTGDSSEERRLQRNMHISTLNNKIC